MNNQYDASFDSLNEICVLLVKIGPDDWDWDTEVIMNEILSQSSCLYKEAINSDNIKFDTNNNYNNDKYSLRFKFIKDLHSIKNMMKIELSQFSILSPSSIPYIIIGITKSRQESCINDWNISDLDINVM